MTITVQELIDSGFAENHDEDTINIVVRINLKKAAIEAGGLEAFASMDGWAPTVMENGVEVPNPESVTQKARAMILRFVNDNFKAAIMNQARAQAEAQAQAAIEALV